MSNITAAVAFISAGFNLESILEVLRMFCFDFHILINDYNDPLLYSNYTCFCTSKIGPYPL